MKVTELAIQLIEEDGKVRIGMKGPLNDKILCLGMMELAKQALLDAKPTGPDILVAQSVPGGLKT